MQIKNKIRLTLLTIVTIIALSGCGGGGGSASFENTPTGTAIVSCTLPLASWTTVNSGAVVSATSGSQIKFDHDSSNNKKVCVVSGSATLL